MYSVHQSSDCLFQNMINKERKKIDVQPLMINDKNKKLIWDLRRFRNCNLLLDKLHTIEKELYNMNVNDREIFLFQVFSNLIDHDIIQPYKLKKINNTIELFHFKQLNDILSSFYNNLNYKTFMITMDLMKKIFTFISLYLFVAWSGKNKHVFFPKRQICFRRFYERRC